MKPPNFRSQKTLLTTFLFVALVVSAGATYSSPQDKPQYTLAEFNAFEAQMRQDNPTKKIKLLDDFTAEFPNSSLMPFAYEFYYQTYYSLRDYPHTIVYVDKLLAVAKEGADPYYGLALAWPPKIESGDQRFSALLTRAEAYAADCKDNALNTPEEAAKAESAAAQGVQVVRQLPTPQGATEEEFARTRAGFEMEFNRVAEIAAAKLKGEPVVCTPPPIDDFAAARKLAADRFDRVMQGLSDEQRQVH